MSFDMKRKETDVFSAAYYVFKFSKLTCKLAKEASRAVRSQFMMLLLVIFQTKMCLEQVRTQNKFEKSGNPPLAMTTHFEECPR